VVEAVSMGQVFPEYFGVPVTVFSYSCFIHPE
jgi:hypothetical protein